MINLFFHQVTHKANMKSKDKISYIQLKEYSKFHILLLIDSVFPPINMDDSQKHNVEWQSKSSKNILVWYQLQKVWKQAKLHNMLFRDI